LLIHLSPLESKEELDLLSPQPKNLLHEVGNPIFPMLNYRPVQKLKYGKQKYLFGDIIGNSLDKGYQ
jgi:hypothetical protein